MFFRFIRELRDELKRFLGELVRGLIFEFYFKVRGEFEKYFVVIVGDVVMENVFKIGVKLIIVFYDFKMKRKEYFFEIEDIVVFLIVINFFGIIMKVLLDIVRKVFGLVERGRNVYILVSGEEDLVVILVVLYVLFGMFVLYG